jgi:hypothetical protein
MCSTEYGQEATGQADSRALPFKVTDTRTGFFLERLHLCAALVPRTRAAPSMVRT